MTIEQRATRMLEVWAQLRYARTACKIEDITEETPIPRGAVVSLEDFDSAGCLFVVEWRNRIFLAEPSELIPLYGERQ
jgi:hypothetical protein